MKTILEQIADVEATRAAKEARQDTVMKKALEEGRSTDKEEGEEVDELEVEIKSLDQDLVRLRNMEKRNLERLQSVDGSNSNGASGSRGPTIIVRSSDVAEKFKGQNFVRQIIAKAVARLDDCYPLQIAYKRGWDKTNPTLVSVMKLNEVPGGGTGAGEWGAELVSADNRYTGDFIEFLHAATVFDKLPLREIPANVQIKGQDGAATGYWVGESKAIPPTVVDFMNVTLAPLKVAALAVVSNELLRDASPAAEMLVRDALVKASAQRIDLTFLSAGAAVAGVSPAGILNGVTGTASAGVTSDFMRTDVKAAYAPFIAAKNANDIWVVMAPSLAKSVSLMINALGQVEFDGLRANGGLLFGDQVVTGDNVTAGNVIFLRPADIYKIGDTGVQVSVSREATIEQNSVPTGATDTPVAATATMTNMFQEESTAIKVVRSINFAKRRTSAVALITGAAYT